MSQGLERRMRFAGRREMPLFKHLAYKISLWSGAYMLDAWEVALIFALFGLFAAGGLFYWSAR